MLLKRAFCSSTIAVKLNTRYDGRLFNAACLKAKRNVKNITVRVLIFADGVLVTHYAQYLQKLFSQFSSAYFSDVCLIFIYLQYSALRQRKLDPIKCTGEEN